MQDIQMTIEQAKKGDQSSFFALYNDTYPRNRYIALRYMKQESDADDVLQDAYIRIFNNLDKYTYNGERSFQSWTSKIVSNTALNHLRKNMPLLFSETEDEEGKSVVFDIEDERIDSQPELSYEKQEVSAIVNNLLEDLSEEQRIVVMMYYFQEFSVKEIASICACSENTVKSRLNYARKNIEKKASDLRKKGILTSAFSLSVLAILLRDDYASAAVSSGSKSGFGALWKNFSQGLPSMYSGSAFSSALSSGIGTSTVTGGTRFFTSKLIITIVCSAILGAGVITGVFLMSGAFSSGDRGGSDSTPSMIQDETPLPTITPESIISPDSYGFGDEQGVSTASPTADEMSTQVPASEDEETPKPENTKKPKKTPKPTEKPQQTPKPTKKPTTKPTEEPVEWDDDFTDWDD